MVCRIYDVVSRVQLTPLFAGWVPSYLFTHLGLMMIALWVAYQKRDFEPIIAYIIAVAISMLNDIIMLGLYFEDAQDATDGKYHSFPTKHSFIKSFCVVFYVCVCFVYR